MDQLIELLPVADVLENQNAEDCCIKSKDSPSDTSENNLDNEQINNENSGSQKTPIVTPMQEKDAIVLSSDDSNQGMSSRVVRQMR